MTETIRCPEPECEGVIEDGYCTITGLAYRPPGPAALGVTGAAATGTAVGASVGPAATGRTAGSAGSAGSAG
ncbi:hypothetical protein ND748_33080, partial [Frankia sp. AiPs1]|uniref:hypothetical protein n=1 Tax=Frankia sp. AiPs1 TaxID=573493 RepID=UPI0035AC1016|nr:hypothetical protein [Frankia sp. AiPs1]